MYGQDELNAFEIRLEETYRNPSGTINMEKMYIGEGATTEDGRVILTGYNKDDNGHIDYDRPSKYEKVGAMLDELDKKWGRKKTAQVHELEHYDELAKGMKVDI
jgi:hypothetical protein